MDGRGVSPAVLESQKSNVYELELHECGERNNG